MFRSEGHRASEGRREGETEGETEEPRDFVDGGRTVLRKMASEKRSRYI